ncbi:MAG TPA: 2-oxoacid:acceptor oxidoreductase family protein [Anaerolineaceae bacterium]|jgi:2-oxoglutarate ferredoxin oxidoreductase subunit gamma|nr:2-oxoacid:acceptor oxidoreductase family protein [Anaerolineaceae bacterium]
MQSEVVVAGFGGQGVLLAGQLLAYAGLDAGREVTWIPSYGPEMRGGTANCTVVISTEEIGSPFVRHPQNVIVFNLPSLDKYEPQLAEGGLLVINGSLVPRTVERTDVKAVVVPANEIAEGLGSIKLTNMVLLGALIANWNGGLGMDEIQQAMQGHLPEKARKLLPQNIEALKAGAGYKA